MDQPFQITTKSQNSTEGTIILEPLRQGFGHTLGNALRRVMLTHLAGAAPVKVKIKGISHQFTTLQGMKEDIVEFVLNLKQLRVAYQGEKYETLKLDATGPGKVKAKDLSLPATVKVANPDLVLATLAGNKRKLSAEITIQSGTGYMLAEEQGKQKLGVIPLDASFSPVVQVSYQVEATRVGRRTDYDKLVLLVKTDGTIKPAKAVTQAAQILVEHFQQIVSPVAAKPVVKAAASLLDNQAQVLALTVEELDLPTRVANALRKGGYKSISDLNRATAKDIAKVKNIGEKSVKQIINKLRHKGIKVKENQP